MERLNTIKELINQGNVEQAIQQLDEILQTDFPGKDEAYYLRGNAYRKQGNWQQALNNYHYAIDLMSFLRGQGIAVPEEISVAGFDDTPVCEMVSPALTTVRQDGAARARIAMEKLQALREGRTVGEEVILPVTLVVRGSTRIRK